MTDKVDRSGPRVEYARRQTDHIRQAEGYRAHEHRLGNLRAVVFLATLVVLWLVVVVHLFHPGWLLVFPVIFFVLGTIHDRTGSRRQSAERRAAFYQRALAGLDGTWRSARRGGSRSSTQLRRSGSPAMRSAVFRTKPSRSARGTSRFTSPISRASAAV